LPTNVEIKETLDHQDVEDSSRLSLVKHIGAASRQEKEGLRQTCIFQTLVNCGNESRKLIIDGRSKLNVVSESTVARIKLPTEQHSQLYHVTWFNNTSIMVETREALFGFYLPR